MSIWNPAAVVAHAYIFAIALVVGVAFGAAFALIPLGLGVGLLVATQVL